LIFVNGNIFKAFKTKGGKSMVPFCGLIVEGKDDFLLIYGFLIVFITI